MEVSLLQNLQVSHETVEFVAAAFCVSSSLHALNHFFFQGGDEGQEESDSAGHGGGAGLYWYVQLLGNSGNFVSI